MTVRSDSRPSERPSIRWVGWVIIASVAGLVVLVVGLSCAVTSTSDEPKSGFPATTEPKLVTTEATMISGPQCEPFRNPQGPAFDLQHVSALIPDGEWLLTRCADTSAQDGLVSVTASLTDPSDPGHSIEVLLTERQVTDGLTARLGPDLTASAFADEAALIVQAAHLEEGVSDLVVTTEPIDPLVNTNYCSTYEFSMVDRQVPDHEGEPWPRNGRGIACLASAPAIQPLVVLAEWSELTPPGGSPIGPETSVSWLGSYLESLSIGL